MVRPDKQETTIVKGAWYHQYNVIFYSHKQVIKKLHETSRYNIINMPLHLEHATRNT